MKALTYVTIALILFTTCFYLGYKFKQPEVQVDTDTLTVYKYDTLVKLIKVTHVHIDSFEVEVPAIIDTQAVINKYFTKYGVMREWKDSNIIVSLSDTLYRNHITYNDLTYKWLRPTQITQSVTTVNRYGSYLTAGFETNLSDVAGVSATASYVTPKRTYNIRYSPLSKETKLSIGMSFTLKSWDK